MNPGQGRNQVAVTLVGHKHGLAGLRQQRIGADDADIRGEESLPQDLAGLLHHGGRVR